MKKYLLMLAALVFAMVMGVSSDAFVGKDGGGGGGKGGGQGQGQGGGGLRIRDGSCIN